eukprot:8848375-Pyramimonas_sp.AAC.1
MVRALRAPRGVPSRSRSCSDPAPPGCGSPRAPRPSYRSSGALPRVHAARGAIPDATPAPPPRPQAPPPR